MDLMPRHMRLHIDRLVLHGFPPGDRHHIADALQARLTELLSEPDLPDHATGARSIARADAGTIQLIRSAAGVGEQLARALNEGLGRWLAR
jgi:hypothetical protein